MNAVSRFAYRSVMLLLIVMSSTKAENANAFEATPAGPPLERTVELLLSPSVAKRKQGELYAKTYAQQYRDAILVGLKRSEDRARVARQLQLLVSPWARGVAAAAENKGFMGFYLPRRPVSRPAEAEYFPIYRTALFEALEASSVELEGDDRRYAVEVLCDVLIEIADDHTLREMARLLTKTDDRQIDYILLDSLCERLGFHRPGKCIGQMCGALYFAEEKLRAEADNERRFTACRDLLLERFKLDKGILPAQEVIMRNALDELDRRMQLTEFVQLGYDEHVCDIDKLEPLIRFGRPLLPMLRERQAAEADLSRKGNYEIIAAAITGRISSELMQDLLVSDHPDRGLACKIVIAAGSRDWTLQIAGLQSREGFDHEEASRALATVLRKDALPYLREAYEFDPNNDTARYAIQELESWDE